MTSFDRSGRPGLLLCTCAGALIGALASTLVPSALPTAHKITLPSFSGIELPAIDETISADATWSDRVRAKLRSAMGLARTVTLRSGDTLGDVLVRPGSTASPPSASSMRFTPSITRRNSARARNSSSHMSRSTIRAPMNCSK